MADESGSNPPPEPAPLSSSLSPRNEAASPASGIPILLIEDNPADVMLIRSALRERGLAGELFVISDGEKALRYAAAIDAHPATALPALIILDLNLPKVHGREILRRFRGGRLAATPVVVLSSSDADKDKLAVAELGAKRYIRKPMDLAEFMEIGHVIEEILRGDTNAAGA